MKISELLLKEESDKRTNTYELTVIIFTHFSPKTVAIKDALVKANLNSLKVKSIDKINQSLRITFIGKLPFSKSNIEQQLTKVTEIIELHNKIDDAVKSSENDFYGEIVINTLPVSPIEWPIIILNNHDKNVSLSGVGDLIKADKVFRIAYTNQISDSVLGLLKIKGKIEFNTKWNNKFKTEEWLSKIIPYIEKGNRDIISCQEDMIDADLKDFAEL